MAHPRLVSSCKSQEKGVRFVTIIAQICEEHVGKSQICKVLLVLFEDSVIVVHS